MKQHGGGGYGGKEIAGRVSTPSRRGIAKTKVNNPLQREEGTAYTKEPDDQSRALTPKQRPMP